MIKLLIALFVVAISSQAQAQTACTALTTAGTLTGTECMATDQSGSARKTDPDAILTHIHEKDVKTLSTKAANGNNDRNR